MKKQILVLDSKSKHLKFETHVDESEPGEILLPSPDISSQKTQQTNEHPSSNDFNSVTIVKESKQDNQNRAEVFFLRMHLSLDEVLKNQQAIAQENKARNCIELKIVLTCLIWNTGAWVHIIRKGNIDQFQIFMLISP